MTVLQLLNASFNIEASLRKLWFAFNCFSTVLTVFRMEIEIPTFRRPRRRRVFTCIVLMAVILAAGGFLIGYFVMKNVKGDTLKCQTNNGSTSKPKPLPNKEKYHKMFQEEIKAKNIEGNLRYVPFVFF